MKMVIKKVMTDGGTLEMLSEWDRVYFTIEGGNDLSEKEIENFIWNKFKEDAIANVTYNKNINEGYLADLDFLFKDGQVIDINN